MNTKHTPTPWTFANEFIRSAALMSDHGDIVADVYCLPSTEFAEEMEANAAFIVRACNAHAELVAALEMMTAVFNTPEAPEPIIAMAVIEKARAALAKAKGE